MNEVITIENTEMQIREYSGQRVVTFKDIDTVHQRPKGTSRNSFNRNKKHFIKNVDYIILKPDEQKNIDYVRLTYIPKNGITLLTESGYLMLVKSFNDDLSWKVQRRLVNSYFNSREQQVTCEEVEKEADADIDLIEEKPKVPLVKGWYRRNSGRLSRICQRTGRDLKTIYHYTLKDIGEKYDLKQADKLFEECTGRAPDKCMDIVEYFPELAEAADRYLDRLERILYGRK